MLNYATVGSNQLPQAVAFYDSLLMPMGWVKVFDHPSGGRIYGLSSGAMFGVVGPHDGQPATVGNGSMFGFTADSAEAVAAFHAKVLSLGGTDAGAPGPRLGGAVHMAYARDLDGNKLCVYQSPPRSA
jgi:catechol 2,3-dioxygenase-like lactoylglutathione lyase family enzyme